MQATEILMFTLNLVKNFKENDGLSEESRADDQQKKNEPSHDQKGLASSREKAKAIIMSGIVFVDGQREDKAGFDVIFSIKIIHVLNLSRQY